MMQEMEENPEDYPGIILFSFINLIWIIQPHGETHFNPWLTVKIYIWVKWDGLSEFGDLNYPLCIMLVQFYSKIQARLLGK